MDVAFLLKEAVTKGVLQKKVFLKILGLGHVLSFEFCKILKNTFFIGHLLVTVSGLADLV